MSALFAHVEPLLLGRRVLVIGNAGSSAAGQLLSRGARLVQVFDPDPRRVSTAAAQNTERKITFSQLTPQALRDGSYDVAVVEDVELADDLGNLILGVKRALAATGTAVFCTRNAESTTGLLGTSRGNLSYDEFSEALWDQFESVSLWGQSPFLGYSIVQFGLDHPPLPVLDNGYVAGQGEVPDYYIALCGNAPDHAAVNEMSIVQLPALRLLADSATGHREKERKAARRVEALEQELAQLRKQVSSSEVERLVTLLEERDSWIRQLESKAATANSRAEDAEAELEDLEHELEKTHQALLDQQQTAKQLATTRTELEQEHADLQKSVAQLKLDLTAKLQQKDEVAHLTAGRKALEEELTALAEQNARLKQSASEQGTTVEKLQKRVSALDSEVDDLHKQLNETDEFLRDAEAELKDTRRMLEQAARAVTNDKEIAVLEEQLKERGRRVLELENQLRKLENYARTLKTDLKDPSWLSEGGLEAEFEQLARTLAEREADLVEAEWTIGQLRRTTKN